MSIRKFKMIISNDGRTRRSWEVDEDDNPVGPVTEIAAEPETLPNGLSAIPERISRFVTSPIPRSALMIFALDRTRGCSLARFGGPVVIYTPSRDRDQSIAIRELFARHGMTPLFDRGQSERNMRYPLPDSAGRAASLCHELLASCLGIAEHEALQFTLLRYP